VTEGGRLDAELVRRGLARSRALAATAIAEGRVTVDGTPVAKPSARVPADAELAVAGDDHYVARSAHKLLAALDAFPVDPAGRLAIDVGASTGGFTQVLLERGAREVIALDVGHGQLVPALRSDPRVRVVEGANARDLTASGLAALSGTDEVPTLVVADVSFISLTLVLPALRDTVGTSADLLLLVKPQFEVGRTGIREGIVRDRALRQDAASAVLWSAHDLGFAVNGILSSPVLGTSGNREYLAWLGGAHGVDPTQWGRAVSALP
jgi:23S rRNA (cytidine1920-2'-O)/16S rRNA (cytidine1409-2'-O)-methyltransferase